MVLRFCLSLLFFDFKLCNFAFSLWNELSNNSKLSFRIIENGITIVRQPVLALDYSLRCIPTSYLRCMFKVFLPDFRIDRLG